jgi:hypothetical protein
MSAPIDKQLDDPKDSAQPPNAPTIEDRVAALEAKAGANDAGYYHVPKWVVRLGFAVVVMTLVLALFTLPVSPLAQSPTPAGENATALGAAPAPTLSACPITPSGGTPQGGTAHSGTPSTNANANAAPAPTLAPLGIASASRTLGNPNAKLALVEYGDFQ